MAKGTKKEVNERVSKVVTFLLDGASKDVIVRYAADEWGVKLRIVETYMQRANERIKDIAQKSEENAFDNVRARTERLYFKAMGKGDHNLARNLLKDIRDLYGFDAVKKMDHTVSDPVKDKLAERMAELSTEDLVKIAFGK